MEVFGNTNEGKEVKKFTLTNKNGMEVTVTDLGAAIVSVKVKDADGMQRDVVLGYDKPADYQNHTTYFGAVIGRNSNRIDQAKITLDGVEYQLEQNDNENNLHSGKNGFHAAIWETEKEEPQSVVFSYLSKDGEQDFPGNMTAKVSYSLTDENELVIAYEAESDKTTVANFTNHTYFNLDGHKSGSIEDHELMIASSHYNPVIDFKSIPTGENADVTGTPMDFRTSTKIGARIGDDFEQLKFVGGYDHNYAIDGADGTMRLAAKAKAARSGICMEVYTDCVGIQLYTGNFIKKQDGKDGASYDDRHGFCLETQYFPNAVNDANFKSPVLPAGEKYQTTTKYCFSVE